MTTPLRVVLVGCGNISRLWLEALQEAKDAELVGLVDLREDDAKRRADEFGFHGPTGSDLGAMLLKTRPDVVFDCTVPEAHDEVTLAALAAGCHVFGEKPMAVTLEQASRMVEQAATSGKVYAVMQNRRHDPNIRAVKAFLDSGAIGRITTINADFYIAAHFGGFRETMRHVLIKDMAIHTFDSARFLSGEEAEAVYCHAWNPEGSWYAHGASAAAIFEMSNGVVFTYRGSWCAEGLHTPWESHWRIIGTKGSLTWDGALELRCEVVKTPTGLIYEHEALQVPTMQKPSAPSLHARAIYAFLEAIRLGTTPETVCTDNIRSLEMVFAACQSADSKQHVALASA